MGVLLGPPVIAGNRYRAVEALFGCTVEAGDVS